MSSKEKLEQFLAQITAEFAENRVLRSAEELEPYSHDESEDLSFLPDAALLPRSTEETARMVTIAAEHAIILIPRGGGTGLSGGALPALGGVVLSLEKMDRILEVDHDSFYARVETGIITEFFQDEMEKLGMFYPPDPASRGSCTIGGNIAENAGGPRAAKYGTTRRWLLGLRGVRADGKIFEVGAPVIKNVAGYDLVGLLCGSEGTLAVITEATVRLISKPGFRRVLLAPFASAGQCVAAVAECYRRGADPAVLEFIEWAAADAAAKHLGEEWPVPPAPALLLVELDGRDESSVEQEMELLAEVFADFGAEDAVLAEDSVRMNALWRLRRTVGEAVKSISTYCEEDTVVPRGRLHLLYASIQELQQRFGLRAITYGHAGDGNLHVNLLRDDHSEEEWNNLAPQFIEALFTETLRLGGSVTGEHGIGWTQKRWAEQGLDPVALEMMQTVKRALDPTNKLNPGKALPDRE